MKSLIRFLVNCYEAMIVLGFILSIGGYLLYVITMIITVLNSAGDPDASGYIFAGAVLGIFLATAFEFMFLVALGAAAVLVDIRNEIQVLNAAVDTGLYTLERRRPHG
jgi:hypothetical protein